MGRRNIELPERNKKVLSLIGEGKDNPTTVSTISKLTGFSSTLVREIVSETVVKYGVGIGTSNEPKLCGYYLIKNEDEKRATVRNLRSRARKILERANVIDSLSDAGQEKFDFL